MIARLNSNLYEMHLSLTNKTHGELISSPIGNRLYVKNRGWGRLWKLFFIIIDLLFGPDFKIKKLRKSIVLTQKTFQNEFSKAKQSVQKFQKGIIQILEEDRNFLEKEFQYNKWQIHRWNSISLYFLNSLQSKTKNSLELVLNRYSVNSSFRKILKDKLLKDFKLFQKIINLESSLQKATPFLVLRKLSQDKILSSANEDEIKAWISHINKNIKKISIRKFHHSLQAIVQFINEKLCTPYTVKAGISRLEYELAKRDLKLFKEPDIKHLQWRKHLTSGCKIVINGKEIVLNEEIGFIKGRDDHNKIFSIENDENQIAVIGINEAILGMKASIATYLSWGIRPATWLEVSEDGRFALVEKLKTPLSSVNWKSRNFLDTEDLKKMIPVINQVKWFIEQNSCIENLSVKTLMYDKDGILKSTKPTIQSSFNLPKIIKFLKNFSQKNKIIYQDLIQKTGIVQHRYLSFFDEVVEKTLCGDPLSIQDLAAFHRIICPYTIKKAIKLQSKLMDYIHISIKNLNKNYLIPDFIELSYFLKSKLLNSYREDLSICFLWNSTQKKNTDYIVKMLRLQNI